MDGNVLKKYKKNIAPLATSRGTFMQVANNNIDYTYWHDPKEFVKKLRLFISSESAGPTENINVIDSIVKEFRNTNC